MTTAPSPMQSQSIIPEQSAPNQSPQIDPTNLPRQLWWPLWQLLMELERIDDIPRREEVKLILQRRLYMRGQQYWWYNNDAQAWYPPNMLPVGINTDDMEAPKLRNVTNIFQATGLSLSSVITQNNTRSQFYPEKASDPDDVATAKNGSKVVDKIHRNNNWPQRMDECGYFMCTDGFFGAYTRYVSDGEKFGHDERDVLAPVEVPIGNSTVSCLSCGFEAEGSTEQMGPVCPDCGAQLQDNPAPTAQAIQAVGTVQIPRGQEVISMVPALQLRRTAYADSQEDFLYLDWVTDLDKAIAMATYGDMPDPDRPGGTKEDSLDGSTGGDESGTAAGYERIARRLLYLGTGRHSGVTLEGLGTFQRAWIRPKAFFRIQDKAVRKQLLQLFPKGVKIIFYNGVYCESKAEGMDDSWETMQTMPGEGALRETLISSLLPIQDQLNDCTNLLFEICMNGVPEGFAAQDLFDFEARNEQGANAGNVTPVQLAPNQTIGQKMMFTQATEPSQGMVRYIEMLFNEIPQFLSGNYPALFGGNTGSNDTAAGIAIQRNQAMGRIGRVWRNFQTFLANIDAKAIKCFSDNRTEDMELAQQGESGDFDSDFVRLQDMQGSVVAFPEVDAQYPVLEADVRALLMSMWNAPNPIFLSVAQQPNNLEYLFRSMGVSDLEVPGQQQRVKTYRDIKQLLQEQPQEVPAPEQPQIPGQPPAPPQPPLLIPSVQPDPDVDDMGVAAQTAKDFLISDKGMEAQQTNPAGYANVKAYLKACSQQQKAAEFKQAIAAQGLAGEGPGADLAGAESMTPPPHQEPPQPGSPPSSGASGGEGA